MKWIEGVFPSGIRYWKNPNTGIMWVEQNPTKASAYAEAVRRGLAKIYWEMGPSGYTGRVAIRTAPHRAGVRVLTREQAREFISRLLNSK